MPGPDGQNVLSPEETARLLRCSRGHVEQLVEAGDLEAERDATGGLTVKELAVLECAVRLLQEQLAQREGAGERVPWGTVCLLLGVPQMLQWLFVLIVALSG